MHVPASSERDARRVDVLASGVRRDDVEDRIRRRDHVEPLLTARRIGARREHRRGNRRGGESIPAFAATCHGAIGSIRSRHAAAFASRSPAPPRRRRPLPRLHRPAEQLAMQRAPLRRARRRRGPSALRARRSSASRARAGVVLGIPSDVGAGFRRGANLGPAGHPHGAARTPASPAGRGGRRRPGRRLRGAAAPPRRHALRTRRSAPRKTRTTPTSPSPSDARSRSRRSRSPSARSISLLAINPSVKPFVLGGDHSTAWPVVDAARTARRRAVGHRPVRRAHRSARGAPRRPLLLRDVVVPRERAARPRREARPGRHPRDAPRSRALGERRSACASSGRTSACAIRPRRSTRSSRT